MLNGDKFEYVDPMGVFDKAENATKPTGYDPANVESNAVREIIKDEMFMAHCGQLQHQRAFLQKKGLCEKTIVDELWKRLTYK